MRGTTFQLPFIDIKHVQYCQRGRKNAGTSIVELNGRQSTPRKPYTNIQAPQQKWGIWSGPFYLSSFCVQYWTEPETSLTSECVHYCADVLKCLCIGDTWMLANALLSMFKTSALDIVIFWRPLRTWTLCFSFCPGTGVMSFGLLFRVWQEQFFRQHLHFYFLPSFENFVIYRGCKISTDVKCGAVMADCWMQMRPEKRGVGM